MDNITVVLCAVKEIQYYFINNLLILHYHICGLLLGILIPTVCVVDLNTKLQQIALQAAGENPD